MKFNIITAYNLNNIIGINNDLYIKLSEDMKYFKHITTDNYSKYMNICIMGYNTWKSIHKPLPNRINIIITSNHYNEIKTTDNLMVFKTFENCLNYLKGIHYGEIFIIGGAQLYKYVFDNYLDNIHKIYTTVFLNRIQQKMIDTYEGDVSIYNFRLPHLSNNEIDPKFYKVKTSTHSNKGFIYDLNRNQYMESMINYNRIIYTNNKVNHEELQYLQLLSKIMNHGSTINSRNSIVKSLFGEKLEFNLLDSFPILTTKRVPWKTVLRELLWFISGSTNNNDLKNKNVHIWDQNSSKEFITSRNLPYNEGDLGPIYGFQWRHFGAEYIDNQTNYNGIGFDQLQYVIDEIKSNPHSRRIILNSWNAIDIEKMVLPPCHVMIQFYIDDKYIDAQLYQRSGDMFLGVPFNITSYAFLLSIIGKITGYIPRKLIHILGDSHIYMDHYDSVRKLLYRIPNSFPKLIISDELVTIDNIKEEYFIINNYNSLGTIKAPMIA